MRPMPIDTRQARDAIGSRLRAVRQERQMTIEHVATATGLTKGFISRVERDQASPSVSNLVALCDVLNLPIGDLFARSEVAVVRGVEAPRVNLGGQLTTERLLSLRSEARVQVIRSSVQPGGSGGDDLYTVNADAEVLVVIEGSVRVRFSDSQWELFAGDALTFSGREPHQWEAPHGAELIWVLVPAAWAG